MTATARIDPRMRARRVAVVRARGRRRLRVLVVVTTALGVAVGAWLVVTSTLLDVDRIAVRGTVGVPEEAVRSAADVDTGDALLLLDLGAVEQRVEEIPAVLDAQVHRDLPDGVRITVVEREPAAWAPRADGTVSILDRTGRVIAEAAGDSPPALPEVRGLAHLPEAGRTTEAGGVATRVLADLPPELGDRVATVVMYGGVLVLRLDDGIEVRLGPPRGVSAKGRTALAVLATLGDAPVAYVDVRVSSAPVTGSTG
ncbi:MAG: cell division protein FtsQ/DivIB [Acidimicrobiia bacterium]